MLSIGFNKTGEICELYFGAGQSILEIADSMQLSRSTVSQAISKYLAKPETTKVLQSKINGFEYIDQFITDNWTKLNYEDIAKELQIKPGTVRYRGHKMGLPQKPQMLRKCTGSPRRYVVTSIVFDKETGIYYNNGMEVSRAYGVNKNTLNNWLKGNRRAGNSRFARV